MKKKYVFRVIIFVFAVMMASCTLRMHTVEAAKSSTKKKAVYTIKKYSDKYSGSKVSASYKYQYPQLKGSSGAVKKINAALKKDYKKSQEYKKDIFEFAKENKDSRYKMTVYTETSCKVMYNKKGYISFYFVNDSYGGGAHGFRSRYAMTFSLKTGKKVAITNVVSGSKKSIKKKIVSKCLSQMRKKGYITSVNETNVKNSLNYTKLSQFNFYLKNGKVVVFFNQYDLGSYAEGIAPDVALKGSY